MIIQFSCENYKSIKDKITLSTIATKDTTFQDSLLPFDKGDKKFNLLPVVSIYGANGAGKSNVLNALGFLAFFVKSSVDLQDGDFIYYEPHKLNDSNEKSSFDIQFIVDGQRYAYGFSNNQFQIIQEYLYHFPNGRQAKIFERDNELYSYGPSFEKELDEIKIEKTRKNRLFLSTSGSWSKLKEILNPFNYLRNDLSINQQATNRSWDDFTISEIANNEDMKKLFIRFLNNLNIEVTDIEAKMEVKKGNDDIPNDVPEELKMLLSKGTRVRKKVKLIYKDMELNLNEESRGIKKLFEIGGPILDIIKNGKTLIYDELETSLHPSIVVQLIKLFLDPKINNKNAQLIFTTHDTNLLDLDLFRRDQIWFVEKNRENYSSDLYSLSDLKNVRKDENIEKGYLKGKYGAIPFMGNGIDLHLHGEKDKNYE